MLAPDPSLAHWNDGPGPQLGPFLIQSGKRMKEAAQLRRPRAFDLLGYSWALARPIQMGPGTPVHNGNKSRKENENGPPA